MLAKKLEGNVELDVAVRVTSLDELRGCGGVVGRPLPGHSPLLSRLQCSSELQRGSDVNARGHSDGWLPRPLDSLDVTAAAIALEIVVTPRATRVPVGFSDILGRSSLEMRLRAIEVLLEAHSRRSVLCVALSLQAADDDDNDDNGGAPRDTAQLCSWDLESTVVHDDLWDVPSGWAGVSPGVHVPSSPRLRLRVHVSDVEQLPESILAAAAARGRGALRLSAWIRDRDVPSRVIARVP